MNNYHRETVAKLEKATEPDRELDCLIWAATNNHAVNYLDNGRVIATPRDASAKSFQLGFIDPGVTQRNFYTAGYPSSAILCFTSSIDAARALLPWKDHPGATFTSKTIQSGLGEFYHFVEFTWPSTERQGRACTEPIATCICALLAIDETERQIAPYRSRAALSKAEPR